MKIATWIIFFAFLIGLGAFIKIGKPFGSGPDIYSEGCLENICIGQSQLELIAHFEQTPNRPWIVIYARDIDIEGSLSLPTDLIDYSNQKELLQSRMNIPNQKWTIISRHSFGRERFINVEINDHKVILIRDTTYGAFYIDP